MPLNTTSVCNALSSDRLGPYRAHTGGDDLLALQHYQHNIVLSEALYSSLQLLEITLRNKFEGFLKNKYGELWYSEAKFLAAIKGKKEEKTLQEAIKKLIDDKKTLTSGGVVAELPFGFWTGLLGNHYHGRFWGPAWKTLLPSQDVVAPSKESVDLPILTKKVNQSLRDIRHLRNRVFHHEPIWNDLLLWSKYQDIRLLLTWISPDVSTWADHAQIDRFRGVYQQIKGLQI